MAKKRASRTGKRQKSSEIVRRRRVVARSRPRGAGAPRSRAPQRPVAGPDAFDSVSEPRHVLSQAATLLLIGHHLRGDAAATAARAQAARPALAPRAEAGAVPSDDARELGFPPLHPSPERFDSAALVRAARVRR